MSAKSADLSDDYLLMLEICRRSPSLESLKALALGLRCAPAELLLASKAKEVRAPELARLRGVVIELSPDDAQLIPELSRRLERKT